MVASVVHDANREQQEREVKRRKDDRKQDYHKSTQLKTVEIFDDEDCFHWDRARTGNFFEVKHHSFANTSNLSVCVDNIYNSVFKIKGSTTDQILESNFRVDCCS